MPSDSFAVLAEPTRRRILDELRGSESSVSELVIALEVRQPTVSKHLKVLRDAGFVSSRVAAQQRIYRIEPGPFERLDDWLRPYQAHLARSVWSALPTAGRWCSCASCAMSRRRCGRR